MQLKPIDMDWEYSISFGLADLFMRTNFAHKYRYHEGDKVSNKQYGEGVIQTIRYHGYDGEVKRDIYTIYVLYRFCLMVCHTNISELALVERHRSDDAFERRQAKFRADACKQQRDLCL